MFVAFESYDVNDRKWLIQELCLCLCLCVRSLDMKIIEPDQFTCGVFHWLFSVDVSSFYCFFKTKKKSVPSQLAYSRNISVSFWFFFSVNDFQTFQIILLLCDNPVRGLDAIHRFKTILIQFWNTNQMLRNKSAIQFRWINT